MNNKVSDIVLHFALVNNVVSTNTNTLTGILYTLYLFSFRSLYNKTFPLVNTYRSLVNTYYKWLVNKATLVNTYGKHSCIYTAKVTTFYQKVNTYMVLLCSESSKVFTNREIANTCRSKVNTYYSNQVNKSASLHRYYSFYNQLMFLLNIHHLFNHNYYEKSTCYYQLY